MNDITVLVLVPNAGDRLPRCLESVAWANDIFCVVDTKTTDSSDEIARRYSNRVVAPLYCCGNLLDARWCLRLRPSK